jgi:TDG/mug DNA glycosylase family protein
MLPNTVLPDVLDPNLRIVFCGVAVGDASARRGAYYAGPGNRFWSVLFEVGLTPVLLRPEQFATLPCYGLGLTDLAKQTSGNDARIAESDFDQDLLRAKIMTCAPAILAFNGKKAAEVFLGRCVIYGLQPETIEETQLFVLPSTSGSARGYWDITHWHRLADMFAKL